MNRDVVYTRNERVALTIVALATGLGLNGLFLYGLLRVPGAFAAALANPISVAFIAESLLLVAVLAYLLARWGVSGRSWRWFVALSLLAGTGFALPVVLLWRRREGK